MLSSVAIALAGVILFSASSLLADEEQKPNPNDKSEIAKVEATKGEKAEKQTGGKEVGDKKLVKGGGKTLAKDGVKKPKKDGKKKLAKGAEKQPVKDGEKKPTKEEAKKGDKGQQSAAVVGSKTDKQTASPAQGSPVDGKFKAGVKLRGLGKATHYVRVSVEVEVIRSE